MRFYTVLASRPQYYDRSATPTIVGFNSGQLAPHGLTQRATYTVPTNRKAFIEGLMCLIVRITAASTAGQTQCFLQYTPFGGSTFYPARSIFVNAAIGAQDRDVMSALGLLGAGDEIDLETTDDSVGGTAIYSSSVKYTEFSA